MATDTIEGVDYAFPPHPDIAGLAAAGIKFACRYGGPGFGKHLTREEADALDAAGIAIVANAEGDPDGLKGGWDAGFEWADMADRHFQSLGMPADRPVYMSVDFDPNSAELSRCMDALRGAAAALGGVHRVGVYGGRQTVKRARAEGVATWFWQTFAWSNGIWARDNHIEQYHNGVWLAGADVDLNRALTADYGQWRGNGMLSDQERILFNSMCGRSAAEQEMTDVIEWTGGNPGDVGQPMHNVQALKRIEAAVTSLKTPVIDYDRLAASIVAHLGSLQFTPKITSD